MFSGIIESISAVISVDQIGDNLSLRLAKPENFNDLKSGDSISCNGVCLTLEKIQDNQMFFSVGPETQKILKWNCKNLKGIKFNLERSLKFGDRVHGHLVLGHVDGMGSVISCHNLNGAKDIWIRTSPLFQDYLVTKGCIAVNGTSLTINEVKENSFNICLIPETLARTNLGELSPGDQVALEADYQMKSILKIIQNREAHKKSEENKNG